MFRRVWFNFLCGIRWALGTRGLRPDAMLWRGNVTIRVRRGDHGPVLREIRQHNLITASGIQKIRDLYGYPGALSLSYNPSNATPGYMAVGTGSTAAASGDTTLVGTEVVRGAITRRVPDTAKVTFYFDLQTNQANGSTLAEAGLFTEPTGGTLWSRVTHSAIVKTEAISVQYQWDWTVAAA